MNGQPGLVTVSCVITTYNYGRFLAEAIDSVLSQSHQAVQVIVVDDGSTDDSVEIAKRYGQKIQLIQQPNSGVVAARNAGAAAATGTYLFFLDADDVLYPRFVEKLVAAVESAGQPNVQLAYCDMEYFGTDTGSVRSCPWNPRKLLYRNYVIPAAIMTRQAFDAVDGYSQQLNQKVGFEDWDLWLSLLEAGFGGVYVPDVLFRYRLHGAGRNGPALKKRPELEAQLRRRHPSLYRNPVAILYLSVFATASRLRNLVIKAPGT